LGRADERKAKSISVVGTEMIDTRVKKREIETTPMNSMAGYHFGTEIGVFAILQGGIVEIYI